MLIILEGTDKAGKSTLSYLLRDAAESQGITYVYLHAGPPDPEKNSIDEYELPLEELSSAIYSDQYLIVCDRWHLGEMVYGPLLRGTCAVTDAQFQHISMLMDTFCAVQVVVHASDEVLTRRWDADKRDEKVSLIQAKFVNRWFVQEALRLDWGLCDTTSGLDGAFADDLISVARSCTAAARPFTRVRGFTGSPNASVLLVGDRQGAGKRSRNGIYHRAFTPAREPSGSALLMNAIAGVQYGSHSQFAVVNGNEIGSDGVKVLASVLGEKDGSTQVIALGADAAKACSRVPYVQIPHPSYWNRFHYGQTKEYESMLASASGIPVT